MTRRDFQLIADAICQAREAVDPRGVDPHLAAVDTVARAIARKLATTNARFDDTRFLAACGIVNYTSDGVNE